MEIGKWKAGVKVRMRNFSPRARNLYVMPYDSPTLFGKVKLELFENPSSALLGYSRISNLRLDYGDECGISS